MSNYYEALKKIKSSGRLKKPRSKIRDRGKVDLEDLIREAEELDAKGKLSEKDFNRIQEIRNEVSNRLLGEGVSVDDIIEESVDSLKKSIRQKKGHDYRGILPKHMQKMSLASITNQVEDQKLNRKMRDKRSLARLAARENYNRLPSETRWDPIAKEETDLLAKYAKEDSLQRGRDILKRQKEDAKDYMDIVAEREGRYSPDMKPYGDEFDPVADYNDAIKMIKGDFSGFFENPRFRNDPLIREAYEEFLYKKGTPIHKIDEFNRKAGGSIVSEKPLTDREKMLRLLEDVEAQTGIDKMFSAKLRDDVSAVGGVLDETPAEMTGMSQMGRRQINDDIKNRLVAFRTRSGEATGTDIDDVLLNPYLSNKDILKSERYNLWKNKKEATLKREQNVNPDKEIRALRDVHPEKSTEPAKRLRASDMRDKSEIIEEAINNRYGSVDDLRKINSDIPEGAEHIVDEANSWLNAYDDAVDAERKWMDLEDNRHAESIADLFEDPAVIDRHNPAPRSRDYGEETLMIKKRAKKTMEDEMRFIAEAAADKGLALSNKDKESILWQIRNRASTRAERRNISPVETLDEILNEIVMRRANR